MKCCLVLEQFAQDKLMQTGAILSISYIRTLQHFLHYAEVFRLCADQSLPGLQQMCEDLKWRAAIAEQQGCFFAENTADSLTLYIDYFKYSQILSTEGLSDIVWCYPALGVRLVPKHA